MCICPIFWVAVMTFARVFRVVGKNRGTQREYSSKPLKNSMVNVF